MCHTQKKNYSYFPVTQNCKNFPFLLCKFYLKDREVVPSFFLKKEGKNKH